MKNENLKSDLFKKFELDKTDKLSKVIGGKFMQITDQTGDVSSASECTGTDCSESTTWSVDSTSMTDSTRDQD